MQQLLTHFAGEQGKVLPTGCCGLAGAFGYGQKRYELSKAIFAAREFDPIRAADKDQVVLATGTSCRAQIRHFTGRSALHPVEWLERMIQV
jgi:Fe-S oxidoreductase